MNTTVDYDFTTLGRKVIQEEINCVNKLLERISSDFNKACELILNCKAKLVVMGIGKSGHIGRKIAATFASTGTPSFFVHPSEAGHGDMGMVSKEDVVIAISYSGEAKEILTILPFIKRFGISLISLTGNKNSSLAKAANVNLDISVEKEACALGLAPTSSTTATLVMGDALAVSVLDAKGFSKEDFALSHPGGALGRRLLIKVDDIMHSGDKVPYVNYKAKIKEALIEMTRCRLGMTAVVDDNNKQMGIFTDGDLRRAFEKNIDINTTAITEVYTKGGKIIQTGLLAAEALRLMEQHKINALLVVNNQKEVIGALNMHDLLNSKVV